MIENVEPVWERIEQLAFLAAGLRREHHARCGSPNIVCSRCVAIAEYDADKERNRERQRAYYAEQSGRTNSLIDHSDAVAGNVNDVMDQHPSAFRFKTGETDA